MTLNIIQQFFLKLFSVFFAMSVSVSGTVAPPSTENPIKPKDADNVKLVFAAFGDTQIFITVTSGLVEMMDDDELDAVAGGACQSGSGRTVVSSGCACLNGQFEHVCVNPSAGDYTLRRTDNAGLRKTWAEFAYGYGGRCGVC